MLGLDTRTLMRSEDQERARAFWLMLRWVPFNVPFVDCPKLPHRGFRWTPETMMVPSTIKMDTELKGENSECTEHLMVTLDGVLTNRSVVSPSIFYVWVKASYGGLTRTDASDHLALLRFYCIQSWPRRPGSLEFDTILLTSKTKTIPSAGEWVPGAAFSRE
ncbi:hypothetical protein PVAG01_09353 [Phlyctema vagabunda]|uniref:Uncharacterized protein n=1 Tax=Phlyctema vagabunda TaxID=108571 RepID=A0ABR4P746_9HELO